MLKFFTLMLMTFILVSCGGGKSTATLSISRGMVLANTAFSGGIYITGEKTDGSQTFQTVITSGNTANVSIGFGNWNLKIIGWHGAGLMAGTAYCKYVANYPFTSEGQNLEVTTSAPDCFTTNISGTSQHVTANTGPWKNLVVNSCGATFNPSMTNITITNGYFNPCSTDYPVEYQKTYGYYKVLLVNQDINGNRTAGISSACLSAQSPATVLFPSRMPVTLKFFKDSACSAEVDEYVFKKGLDFSLSEGRSIDAFDWGVTADSAHYFVTVANGLSKRGTTAFHSEVPVFKCIEAGKLVPCPKLPTTSVNTYYLDPDTYGVIKLPQQTCGTLTSTGGFTLTKYSCDNKDGNAYIGLKATTATPVSGTISMNGTTYTLIVGNIFGGFSNDRIRDAYKTLKRTIGYRNIGTNYFNDSLADDYDEDGNEKLGALDSAIFDMSALGAGGTFYDQQCSSGFMVQIPRSYVKDGFSYTVALSGITSTPDSLAPGFTARSEEPEHIGSENHYNRRLVIRKLVGGSYTTEKIIDISCDNDTTSNFSYVTNAAQVRNGRMEEQRNYLIGTNPVTLKNIVYWNTASSDTARFDIYKTKKITNSTGTTQKMERSFYRVAKSNLSDSINHFKIHGMTYLTVRDGAAFDESIIVSEVDGKDTSGTLNYSHKRAMDYTSEDGTIGDIFGSTFAHELNKIRFGYHDPADEQEQSKVSSAGPEFIQARRSLSTGKLEVRYTDSGVIQTQPYTFVPDNIATDISDNGLNKIAASNDMNTIYYYKVIAGSLTSATLTTGNDPLEIRVGIRDDGSYIISWVELVSTKKLVKWYVDGTSHTTPYTSYNHSNLSVVKDTSEFYLNFIRTDNLTGQYSEICKSGGACNGFASRVSGNPFTYSSLNFSAGNLYATYIHDGVVNTTTVNTSTLFGGTQVQATGKKFNQFVSGNYTKLDTTTVLRSVAGTQVETDYPYYSPTLNNFEMKPIYLKSTVFDSYFASGFSSITN